MTRLRRIRQQTLCALLCVALAVWSAMPSATHAPAVFETIQDHLEMIAEHGHSHGFEEDLYWAMHGHGHDAADHDHGQAYLDFAESALPVPAERDAWRLRASPGGSHRIFRIERPPRA